MKKHSLNLLRLLCAAILIISVFGFLPVQAESDDPHSPVPQTWDKRPSMSHDDIQTDSDTYINPVYSDVVSELDFNLAENKIPSADTQSVQSDTITSAPEMLETVRDIFKSRTAEGELSYNIPKSEVPEVTQIKDLFRHFAMKVMEHNGIPDEGDYLMFQYGGFKVSYSYYTDENYYRGNLSYMISFYTDAAMEKESSKWTSQVMEELNLDDYHDIEKIRRIYKYVNSNFTYDYANLYKNSDYLKYTMYGGILRGSMVCQGYAVMIYRLMLEAGIDCRVISGMATNSAGQTERHAWNIVRLLDKYYNIDSTWDANWLDNEKNYKYFLKSMAGFLNHNRGNKEAQFSYDYDSDEFSQEYPMAESDYVAVTGVGTYQEIMDFSTLGTEQMIPFEVYPENATVKTVTCIPADPKVFRYEDPCWLTGWEEGDSSVQIISDDGLYECSIPVHAKLKESVNVSAVVINHTDLMMKQGDSFKLSAETEPSDASDRRIFWTSSDPSVVSVASDGTIHALAKGNAVITAAAGNSGIKSYCIVKVYSDPLRIFGNSRFETSMKIADAYKEEKGIDQFESVILTSGTNFADALAGSYLSYVKDAPILITADMFGGVEYYKQVNKYIKANLKAKGTVYVLGGEAAVSEKAIEELKKDFSIRRLAGSNRYETNIRILEEANVKDEDILVCTGYGFADSLSASAAKRPILLVGSSLSADQKAYLNNHKKNKYYAIGGDKAVTSEVENELKAYGSVKRLAGSTRHETSVMIAEEFCPNADNVVMAFSYNFPDGLCGGPLAAAKNAPIILTRDGNEDIAAAWCKKHNITEGLALGGYGLISDEAAFTVLSE